MSKKYEAAVRDNYVDEYVAGLEAVYDKTLSSALKFAADAELARAKISALKEVLTEVSIEYNALTKNRVYDAEKAGQIMALQSRIDKALKNG